ncbi:hypothetical protein [Curtobacterium sp. 9128]|uniref:hypothetical protein n=1 Tax=Curtobacterium sp. 9128 TaxID=1793722 RepID=UPI0011AAF249|nr:hypothetical protein [Curtobacterium sp. 9128]
MDVGSQGRTDTSAGITACLDFCVDVGVDISDGDFAFRSGLGFGEGLDVEWFDDPGEPGTEQGGEGERAAGNSRFGGSLTGDDGATSMSAGSTCSDGGDCSANDEHMRMIS